MTEEGLSRPQNIERMIKNVANILGIYFKCRKGRGPYLSFWSSPRRYASLWNYVRFLTLCPIFLINIYLETILNLLALFSCKYCQGLTHWRFLINFWNKYIGSAVTHTRPTSCDLPFILTFYSYLPWMDLDMNCRVWCGKPPWTLWCEKNRSRQFIYIFNYFMKIWRMKKSVFPCAALSGWFFGSADCDLNSFLSEWTAGMRLYWQYVSET